jgi:uncharacterized RDD family membrane protein YckC
MQCRYCRAWSEEDERRCVRCGRRLHLAASRPMGLPDLPGMDTMPLSTATAPALEIVPDREPQPVPERAQAAAASSGQSTQSSHQTSSSFQTSLFRDASNGPKVIPIPTLMPVRNRTNPEWEREDRVRDESAQKRRAARPPKAAARNGSHRSDSQQSLDFYGAHGGQPALGTQVEAVIYCDAPVALPAHRMIAAMFDAAMVLLAAGLVMGIFAIAGGSAAIMAGNAVFFLAVTGILALFYRFLWCLANGDTPGMRFAGLRLVDFDGRVPDRERRGMRQVAGILSLISAGLGLVWALVDEESLTWHDHISKTFPTAS